MQNTNKKQRAYSLVLCRHTLLNLLSYMDKKDSSANVVILTKLKSNSNQMVFNSLVMTSEKKGDIILLDKTYSEFTERLEVSNGKYYLLKD